MPIYEFICQECGSEFEQIMSFSATKLPHCPRCNSTNVQRQVGRPAIHFKGSGWYITDSKNSGKSAANGTTADDKGEKGDKSSTSTAAESQGEGAKGDTAKSDTAKGDSAKGDSAKSDAKVKSVTDV
ncbi:MAG: zinc ribbon domain-containing protein [Caldilineaceae bacterium]